MRRKFAGGIPFKRINDEFYELVIPEVSSVILEAANDRLSFVQVGDKIKRGSSVFFESEEFSAICAGISGIVKSIERANGTAKVTITASKDFSKQIIHDPLNKTLSKISREELSSLLRRGGVPVPKAKKAANFLTIDCGGSPYDISGTFLCTTYPDEVIGGAMILMKLLDTKMCYFAIPSSCLNAAQSIEDRLASRRAIMKVTLYKEKYPHIPQLTVGAISGIEISAHRKPEDVGYPVITPNLCYAAYQALANGVPFGSDFVSITEANEPTDIALVPFGANLYEVFDVPIGYKLIRAEGVFGIALDEDERMKNGISALMIVKDEPYPVSTENRCIGCRRCIEVCPGRLIPSQLYSSIEEKNLTVTLKNELLSCFECGCCSAVCPAYLPIYERISSAKNEYLYSAQDAVNDEVVELTQVPFDTETDNTDKNTVKARSE